MTPRVKQKGRSRVSSKNQVTLPVSALHDAGVRPGDEVVIRATGHGRLEITVVDDALESLIGSAPGLSAATGLEEERDAWAR